MGTHYPPSQLAYTINFPCKNVNGYRNLRQYIYQSNLSKKKKFNKGSKLNHNAWHFVINVIPIEFYMYSTFVLVFL